MKRALAERAKQASVREVKTHTPTSDVPENPSSLSSSISPPPAKIPRVASSSLSSSGVGSRQIATAQAQHYEPASASVSAIPSASAAETSAPASTMTAAASPSQGAVLPNAAPSSSSRAGQKRQRSTTSNNNIATNAISSNDTDNDTTNNNITVSLQHVPDNASAFYLVHQNRALVVEWQSLHRQVQQLEKERQERRQDCWAASQALHSLQATWTQLETAVTTSVGASTAAALSGGTTAGGGAGMSPTTQNMVGVFPSTGNGDAVEWTGALSDALATLALATTTRDKERLLESSNASDDSDNAGGGTSSAGLSSRGGALRADWSSQCAANLAARAAVLQEHLWPLILRNTASAAPSATGSGLASSSTPAASSSLEDALKTQKELLEAQAHCRMLETQVAELASCRDAATTSERKARRNVYRLAAGMMTTEQLVKEMDNYDNDNDDVEWKQMVDKQQFQHEQLLLLQQQEQILQQQHHHQSNQQPPLEDGTNPTSHDATTLMMMLDNSSSGGVLASSASTAVPPPLAGALSSAAMTTTTASLLRSNGQAQITEALQAKVADLEQAVLNREESVQELEQRLKEKEQRITELSLKQRSQNDDSKLEKFASLSTQLELAQASVSDFQTKLEAAQQKWVEARSNEETAVRAVQEQQGKFEKRWTELSRALSAANDAGGDEDEGDEAANDSNKVDTLEQQVRDDMDVDEAAATIRHALLDSQTIEQAKQITQLQHKLSQAMENVRQCESTRKDLKDALGMNESLHAKLEELKTKYAAIRNNASSSSTNTGGPRPQSSSDAVGANATSSSSSAREVTASSSSTTNSSNTASGAAAAAAAAAAGTSSSSSERVEKLHREHRRMRKEMSAVVASKEAAKAKLERAEKERDSLMEGNARFLKQITEKDDMNAKSLSTILHLKSMTEQLTLERDNLEQQVKSASQLALAARLATNAKERLSEEVVKEKEALEQQLQELELKFDSTKKQLDKITLEWSEASAKTTTLNGELSNALKRIEELVSELEQKNAQVRKLTDTVSTAEREAREATGKLQKLSKQQRRPSMAGVTGGSGGGGDASAVESGFTVDQLNTQISVLKNRLGCPVCHYRDKECIIMRCRHMHCKQCVEERITNRSRKCPTCNNRFSEKDVEDIWLN